MADRLSELVLVLETLDAHGLQTAAERVRWATAEIERLRQENRAMKLASLKQSVVELENAALSGGAHE